MALAALMLVVCVCAGCGGPKRTRTDTTSSGMASFVCDQNFTPLMEQQVGVFESLYKDATLFQIDTDEASAMDMLLSDSVRMAIVARDLTEAEKARIKQQNRQLTPRSQKLAVDGLAVIVHRTNGDTLMTTDELRRIMLGEVTRWEELGGGISGEIEIVFDHPNSANARYVRDSVCGGAKMSDRLSALASSEEVLARVADNPLSLGIIGVGYICHPHDTTHLSFNESVNVVALSRESEATEYNSYKPVPAYLHLRKYPLWREVYILLTDHRGTLPSGFTNFIASDRGQRIILKAGLVPATAPIRTVLTRDEL